MKTIQDELGGGVSSHQELDEMRTRAKKKKWDAEVKEHFENFGYVRSVRLMKDKRTGKRKGFGFVEVSVQEADSMIEKLNDSEFQERTIKVRPAKDKVA